MESYPLVRCSKSAGPHKSVSYTHLDVYKRQYMCRQSVIQYLKTHEPSEQYAEAIEQLINDGIVNPIPVSYTHLDVYKRQILELPGILESGNS